MTHANGDAWAGNHRGGQRWGADRSQAGGAERVRDQGWEAIDKILGGLYLPRWNVEKEMFVPRWESSAIDLANKIIGNAQAELKMSKENHEAYKRANKAKGLNPHDGKQNLGWLERTNIWNRACESRAVISLTIKLVGLQLQERKHDQAIDRVAAATAVHGALLTIAGQGNLMKWSILDVVCSKADKEQMHAHGLTRASATFYVRIPAFVGLIAHTQWLPRLRDTTIMQCNVTAYFIYETGKETMGMRNAQHWPTTVHGVEQPRDNSDLAMIRYNVYDPEGDMAKKIAKGVLDHSNQYAQKQIGDFTFFKTLPLQNIPVPANKTDEKTLYETSTWKLYQMLKSGVATTIWQGLLTLMAAGAGEVVHGKWHPQQPAGSSYKLYCPELMAYDEGTGRYGGEGGHLDLYVGEMALTFETPVPLTYTDPTDKKKTFELDGVMAMAVSAQPQFNIRRCSTYHWARDCYEMKATEYVIMKAQIEKLMSKGVNQLAHQLGQITQKHGTPQTVTMPMSSTMTMPMSSTVAMQPLIDLETPQEQPRAQLIPLPEGSGPLRNLQVDQWQCERKRERQRELDAWFDIEVKDYTKISEQLKTMTESMEKNRHLIKMEKASQKMTLLQEMLSETMNRDGPFENIITEFMRRFQSQELDFSRQMFDMMKQENDRLNRMMKEYQASTPQVMEETASVCSANWDRVDGSSTV